MASKHHLDSPSDGIRQTYAVIPREWKMGERIEIKGNLVKEFLKMLRIALFTANVQPMMIMVSRV
jgi:hypothetical protein